jgi:glycosyltransferase involved in cell wall biosynthesis
LLVNPEKPEEIAGALRWLFEHPEHAEEMGKRGREAVRSQYNWETEGRKLVAFYDSLLS